MQHGRGLLAQLIVGLFGFPKAVNGTQVSVTVERTGEHERWTRNFSGRKFASEQFAGRGGFENLLCERFGPFVFGIALVSDSDRLSFVVRHWRFSASRCRTHWRRAGTHSSSNARVDFIFTSRCERQSWV